MSNLIANLKRCNEDLQTLSPEILGLDYDYAHFEIVAPSNASFAAWGGSPFRKIRDAIVTGATTGPVQLVTSCEDGFTTNVPGLVLWLESLDSAHPKNLNLSIVKRDSEDPLQFATDSYIKAYKLLQEGSQNEEVQEYENELQFLAVQLGAGQNKIAYVLTSIVRSNG